MDPTYTDLKNRLAEISDFNKIQAVLGWDQRTMMPAQGAPARAEQLASLARLIYEKSTSPELGRLLEKLRLFEESLPSESDAASLIRVARRDYEKLCKVPVELRVEMTRTASVYFRSPE